MIFCKPNNQLQLSVLNEVYIGKTPELLAIEHQLDIIRQRYMGKYHNPKINSDPDLIKFNRMIEDYFGFGCFALQIEPGRYMMHVQFL